VVWTQTGPLKTAQGALWQFTTTDHTNPYIIIRDPPHLDSGVSVGTEIRLTFNEVITPLNGHLSVVPEGNPYAAAFNISTLNLTATRRERRVLQVLPVDTTLVFTLPFPHPRVRPPFHNSPTPQIHCRSVSE